MRLFLLLILSTMVNTAHAFPSGNTLGDIRDAYVEAIDKASAAKAFNQRMQKLASTRAVKAWLQRSRSNPQSQAQLESLQENPVT